MIGVPLLLGFACLFIVLLVCVCLAFLGFAKIYSFSLVLFGLLAFCFSWFLLGYPWFCLVCLIFIGFAFARCC